ncbi:MAG: DUF4157 domain-containing protein [Pseudomonadota bacterium]|nr:DUF4157 domain-containing protein [Pseudomonadota bacterium]
MSREAVVQTEPQVAPTTRATDGLLQRKCSCGQHTGGGECTSCGPKKPHLKRHPSINGETTTAHPSIDAALRTPGRPLDTAPRRFMESRFGQDFSQVRVHTGPEANESTRTTNALAYTVGRDVVFAADQYAPDTTPGRHLLAHELTHVLQQRQGDNRAQQKIAVSHPADASEREADRVADAIVHGTGRVPGSFASGHSGIQRVCGPALIGTPAGCDPRGPTFVTGHPLFKFDGGCDDFSGTEGASLGASAATLPASGPIIIHGYSSADGDPTFNENLSCARAVKAETVLTGAGIAAGRITKLRHGPTPGPTADRRSVVIEAVSPSPGPVPAPGPTPGPTVVIFPVIFGSTANRVPPGVGTPVVVVVTGLPSGSSISLDILGSGGSNGTATVAPATITGTSVVTVTGGTQTTPGSANNLMIRASLGGVTHACQIIIQGAHMIAAEESIGNIKMKLGAIMPSVEE